MPYYQTAPWFEDGKPGDLPADFYSSELLVDRMIEYLDARRDERQPFFAYVAFQAVHIPVQAPREFTARYEGRFDAGWEALREARWAAREGARADPRRTPRSPRCRSALRAWDVARRRRAAHLREEHGGLLRHDRGDGPPHRPPDRTI